MHDSFIIFFIDMSECRLAMVGDSHMRKLYEEWLRLFPPRVTSVQVEFFWMGGARLDGATFANQYVPDILAYQPHKTFLLFHIWDSFLLFSWTSYAFHIFIHENYLCMNM